MNKKLKYMVLAGLAGAAMAPAHAGLVPELGVTFTPAWSGNVLTLEIDAAGHKGDWAKATGLAALEVDGFGNYTSVTVAAAPKGATSWTTSSSELNNNGCSGDTNGQAGSRLCFFGSQIALSDDMVFSFAFSGSDFKAADPDVKVKFVDDKGKKVGTLFSASVAATYVTPADTNTNTNTNTNTDTTNTDTTTNTNTGMNAGAAAGLPVEEIPPVADQAHTEPTIMPGTPDRESGGGASPAQVPEPQSIALLMAGLGLMGLVARRKRR